MSDTAELNQRVRHTPPLPPAERMRVMRDRIRQTALSGPVAWQEMSDTRILESIAVLLKNGKPVHLALAARELIRRAVERSEGADQGLPGVSLLPQRRKPGVKKGQPKGYPVETKARAILAKARRVREADILAEIRAECGRAPSKANFWRLLQRWRVDPRVQEAIAQIESGLNHSMPLSDVANPHKP